MQYQTETVLQTLTRICHLESRDKFCTSVFFAIIGSMTGASKIRLVAYTLVRNLFGFLHKIFDLTPKSICESSNQWSFHKIGTMGTLPSQEEIGVCVQASGVLLRGSGV